MSKPLEHVMLDIETLSTHKHNSVILSIGLKSFDMEEKRPLFGTSLRLYPGLREQFFMGRQADIKTQQWWMKQEEEARRDWLGGQEEPITDVLHKMSAYIMSRTVWAHGIQFDIGNVEALYDAKGVQVPWEYNKVFDNRTMVRNLEKLREQPEPVPGEMVPHDPISDCIHQIWALWEVWRFNGSK
jgi:hypothetical protein